MALLITLFLVLINIFNNITTNSPKAEGLTAIEIWMLACILFVFGDYNNKDSEVHKLRKDERAYDLLDHLNVRPSVFYQTKVRNKQNA